MSTIPMERLRPEQVPKHLAIEALQFLASMELPPIKTLEDLQGFLDEQEITQVLCAAIDQHGQVDGRRLLHRAIFGDRPPEGTSGREPFFAAVYPGETPHLHMYAYNHEQNLPLFGVSLPLRDDYSLDLERRITAAHQGTYYATHNDPNVTSGPIGSPEAVLLAVQDSAARMALALEQQ